MKSSLYKILLAITLACYLLSLPPCVRADGGAGAAEPSYSALIKELVDKGKKGNDEVEAALEIVGAGSHVLSASEIAARIRSNQPVIDPKATVLVPEEVLSGLIREGDDYRRLHQVLKPLLQFCGLDGLVHPILFKSELPVIGSSAPNGLMISTRSLALLSEEELRAIVAHELCHLIVTDAFRAAVDAKDYHTLRIIELFCDAGSAAIMKAQGYDPGSLINGLLKIWQVLELEFGERDLKGKHPVVEAVSACVQKVTKGNMRAFVNLLKGISRSSLDLWIYEQCHPQLGALMALCYKAGIPVKDFLLGEVTRADFTDEKIRSRANCSTQPFNTIELAQIKNKMQAMLEEDPPQSVKSAARRIGCHHLTIKKYYPEFYCALNKRFSAYTKKIYDKKEILTALQNSREEVPPPSLNEVARRLRCSRGFLRLHFPEECRVIVKRYDAHRNKYTDLERIEGVLRHLHSLDPPLSLQACAVIIGCSSHYLPRLFPELCRQISARYNGLRLRTLAKNRKRNQGVIRKTIKALQAQGVKPTAKRIRKQIPHVPLFNRNVEALISETSA
jgi:hypothetical protein